MIAFNMDVSVSGYGGEVANLDLMEQRQNHLIVACLMTLVGVLLSVFGKTAEQQEQRESGPTYDKSKRDAFDGEANLNDDAYRLWLADKYGIAKNDVFDRFVIGDQTFATLDDALCFADDREAELRAEAARKEAERQAAAEEQQQQWQLAAEEAEAQWEKEKPKVFAGLLIMAAILVGLVYSLQESPEEQATRLAAEKAEALQRLGEAEEAIGVSLPDDVSDVEIQKGADSYFCEIDSLKHGMPDQRQATIFRFSTRMNAADVKSSFVEALGNGQPSYRYLDDDDDDWAWKLDDRIVSLKHMTQVSEEKVVCVITDGKS